MSQRLAVPHCLPGKVCRVPQRDQGPWHLGPSWSVRRSPAIGFAGCRLQRGGRAPAGGERDVTSREELEVGGIAGPDG